MQGGAENSSILWYERTRKSKFQTGNIPRGVTFPVTICECLDPTCSGYSLGKEKEKLNHSFMMDLKLYSNIDDIDSLVRSVSGSIGLGLSSSMRLVRKISLANFTFRA